MVLSRIGSQVEIKVDRLGEIRDQTGRAAPWLIVVANGCHVLQIVPFSECCRWFQKLVGWCWMLVYHPSLGIVLPCAMEICCQHPLPSFLLVMYLIIQVCKLCCYTGYIWYIWYAYTMLYIDINPNDDPLICWPQDRPPPGVRCSLAGWPEADG